MATQKVKGGYKVKLKSGGLGKTVFKTQAAAQRRSRGKVGKAAKRRAPARKAPAKKKTTRRKSVAKKNTSNNRKPKIGAAIQAFKGAQPLISPVIDTMIDRQPWKSGANAQAFTNDLRHKANFSYAGNVAATAVNQAVDRKIAQGGALSRGSLTAWAAEGFAALQVANEVRGQPAASSALAANRRLALTLNGYDPDSGTMNLADPGFRTYQGLKIGGGVLRRASNMGPLKRAFAPVKKFLGEMGGAL